MRNIRARGILLSLLLMTACLTASVAPAAAFNPFSTNQVCHDQNTASAPCQTNGSDPLTGPNGILLKATNIIAYLAGAIAIIMIIVGAIRFITSGSDMSTGSRTDTDVEDAKRSIIGALIGLAIIILAKFIITYVIGKL